ncbi:alpha/beta hydrolase fold domain-containing protein [Streptomyces sp. NBC_00996]|uniref:alpha/beta hydrolase fold domain-containing protein n=1 Tax=Streptomyces sp. NBC_00996 TaxID=2903710 RepID=UPI003865865C|nr:alpha/beta hydrolase [Streptomyces sp. NBC_00996]
MAKELKDIAYGDGLDGQLIDLYVPDGDGPRPLVIWSHGSGWLADTGRDDAEVVARRLNPHGFAVAGLAIRSSAQTRFPGQLRDIEEAIHHLRTHSTSYGLDPGRIGMFGESSGGWAAALAALTVDGIRAAVPVYPPTELLSMDEQMLPGTLQEFTRFPGSPYGHDDPESAESRLLGGPLQQRPQLARRASPSTYVGQDAPPFLILHGKADRIVPYGQGELFYEALAKAGADVELITLPHADHGPWNDFLTDPVVKRDAFTISSREGKGTEARPCGPTWDTVVNFFHRHL